MKTKVFLITTLLMTGLTSSSAQAWVRPGWDRPRFRAELTILDQEGQSPQTLENAKNIELVMTQQDGATSTSDEGKGFILLIDGQFNQAYQVKSASKNLCNSTTYALIPVQSDSNYRLDAVSQMIEVVDHSTDHCLDSRRYQWELNFKKVNLMHDVLGQARLAGNPSSVITPL